MTERVEDNVDPGEVARFNALASQWWDPQGEFWTLHAVNPLRLAYVRERAELAGARALDVGCGGGLLAEALAAEGARVTGIDLAPASLTVARLHLRESGADVEYVETSAERYAHDHPGEFDVVTCFEMLEHVPEPASVIRACARAATPGGQVFFSTLNRNPKSFLFAIAGAEYLLNMIPRGTHEYAKFIRPSELEAWARDAGLALNDVTGLHYNPLTRGFRLGGNVDVNYFMHCSRSESA